MKLNLDCIRDILLTVEEKCDMYEFLSLPCEVDNRLSHYSEDEIMYHVRQCDLSGMLYNTDHDMSGNYSINDLSPAGHEFLANIRKDTIWNDVKEISGKVGAFSMKAITQIASSVISEIIKSQLGSH